MNWIMFRECHTSLLDMKAAVDLFKEVHGAKNLLPGLLGTGLVFETSGDIPELEQEVLGVVPFI